MRSTQTVWRAFLLGATIGIATTGGGCNSHDEATPTLNISASRYGGTVDKTEPKQPPFNLHPVVEVQTSAGQFTLELDGEHAPLTVDNFLSYVESKHYDGTVFHQVIDGFIVLGGGYDKQLSERPTRPAVRNEAHNGLSNHRGTIAMARQGDAIDSAKDQFFLNLADNTSLDHTGNEAASYGYCVFGEVTKGMDVVERIAKTPVKDTGQFTSTPTQSIVIESVRRVR